MVALFCGIDDSIAAAGEGAASAARICEGVIIQRPIITFLE
ncbi:MAG: hypothetical protein ACO3JL_18765 [Myxococcota bacterium]